MRPHRLRLSAFGPFAGTVDVDLDALAESGLFLLHGETGAGKTTLLDGLGFALFGRVPGVRAQAKRLRSDHAEPATRTEVQLEATLSGRRVRITRSPEQEREKLRGSGTTKEPAKVLLEEHDGARWHTVSTRVGEADRELADLVGMSAEQFFQVVLLPQGDFARFLRAGSDERAALLERLFATDRFRAVEQWLVDRRRTTAAARDAAQETAARLVARIAQVAGEPEPEAAGPGWAEPLVRAAAAEARAADHEALGRQAALDQALAADEQARRLAERQQRRGAALAEHQELQARAPEVEALTVEVEAAGRAAEVAAALDDAVTRARALGEAEQACGAAARALPAAVAGAGPAELQQARGRLAERAGRLQALQDDADRADAEDRAAAKAQAAAQAAERERQQVLAQQAALPGRRAAAERRREQAHAASVRLPDVRAEAVQRRSRAADALSLAAEREGLAALRVRHLAARESAADAREAAQGLREARMAAMVSELAAVLVDGDPCLVCGALSHPDPAEVQGERVDREQEEAAAAEADRLRTAAEHLAAEVAAAQATCAALAERTGDVDPDEEGRRAAALEQEIAELDRLTAGADAAAAEVHACEAEGSALAARLAALEAAQAAALEEAAAAAARAQVARAAVTAQLCGDADLQQAQQRVAREVEAVDQALRAHEQLLTCSREAERARTTAVDVAQAAGFAGVDDAAAARRDAAWRAQSVARCRGQAEAVAAVQALLAEPDLDVELDPPADPEATAAVVEQHRLEHAVAAAEAGRLGERSRQLSALLPQLDAALLQLAPLVARAAEVKALADLATGQGANTLRMTLSAYVLAARLEEVAAVASERLLRMTQGRYSLVHTDVGVDGRAKAGLGLLARDTWTGQDRDTGTLSGGETFLASLALALGLADVVAAESGGARTEALFVDEGFGTLDEQALEEVMDVLDGLREGGRLVGVVSHVGELRQRIPAQVHVRKSRTGSEVALIGC